MSDKLNITIITDSIRTSDEMIRDMVLPITEVVAKLCPSRDYDKVLAFLKNSSINVCPSYCKESVYTMLSKMLHLKLVKTEDVKSVITVLNKCKNALLLVDNSTNLTEINELVKMYRTTNTHYVYNYNVETGYFEVA